MSVVERYVEQIAREARQATGIPEPKTALELVDEYLPRAVKMIDQIASSCPDPKIRLDASKTIVELAEVARREREKRDEQYYAGNPDVLRQVSLMPHAEQRRAALQMFANQIISRVDLDAVLKVIDSDLMDRIKALTEENEKLVKVIEGDEPIKTIGKIVNSAANGASGHA